jgi:TRAP-type uncharacterized transport system substrate-binding protein
MSFGQFSLLSRGDLVRSGLLVAGLVAAALWVSFHFLEPAPPRRIVLASGAESGLYHLYAQRYRDILARDGVTVDERITAGAAENLALLLDPKSGVDVAFLQGGVARFPEAGSLEMLASLYYEPLWIFYRGSDVLTEIRALAGKRVAVGVEGSGTRSFVLPLLAINGLLPTNTALPAIGGGDALAALRSGDVDAALFVGGAQSPLILDAVRDPTLRLMSLQRADAYVRRFPYISKLTLPAGTLDFAVGIPPAEVQLIGTKAMLAARDDLHPALINLLTDAAREIHGEQGYFEAAGEFPSMAHVDIPVSPEAERHRRFGPNLLHRYLPFWMATFVERAVILLVQLIVVVVPLLKYRSRIYRWYGELTLLARDVEARQGTLPIEQWLHDIDRIERAVAGISTPASFASEAYTLREHVGLVRRAVQAKAAGQGAAPG